MARVRTSVICSLGAILVLAALWGCNGTNIDNPSKSDSVLVVQSVEPASVQADVTPTTDPNTLLVEPPKDDTVVVKVKNVNRTQSSTGVFGDIMITGYNIQCNQGSLNTGANPACAGGFCPASLTVAADASADVSVLVAAGPYKQANSVVLLALGSDVCTISFEGQDLSGDSILSTTAVFGVSFVDTP